MDENMSTPHPQDPAEGAPGVDVPDENSGQGDGTGGAIQGDSSRGESTGGAIQGSSGPGHDAPLGGDDTTEDELAADNPAEEDTLKTLDPDSPPA
ncbi:hypothetical protein [Microbacterium sp. p3-SID336]|uniref:hypothetical protein n=1 Tax=Microbacterium sp. p3-SID336 TaxID=2916212 RepID=UPI0021A3A6B3|nr:hypothetical protein [Microbacterium sp. p3-SID336]MCT1476820.1 hypothetical protein [Microbacterium sp. p3-SID336]